jgi:hypothetical protein
MLRYDWKQGPAAGASGTVVVSATKFTYRRFRDMPAVIVHGWRLRRGWGARPGAVGLFTGGEPLRRVTYSLSVWTSEEDLRRFLRSPEHLEIMRRYRPRLAASTSVLWETDELSPGSAWHEGLRRLAAREEAHDVPRVGLERGPVGAREAAEGLEHDLAAGHAPDGRRATAD